MTYHLQHLEVSSDNATDSTIIERSAIDERFCFVRPSGYARLIQRMLRFETDTDHVVWIMLSKTLLSMVVDQQKLFEQK